jgi:hypothetical protein
MQRAMPSALFSATLAAFKGQGWAFQPVTGLEVIEANFEAHHTKVPLHVQIYGEAGILSVVARATVSVPGTHRLQVCELLMRTNKELNVGNFELDWDAGTVMFRTTQIFPGGSQDEKLIAGLVHASVGEVDRLTPFLAEVCRTPRGELLLLRVADLMKRQDLLPPPLES